MPVGNSNYFAIPGSEALFRGEFIVRGARGYGM
jgi:hypothetical protein